METGKKMFDAAKELGTKPAKSVCYCGHNGDGYVGSEHDGLIGHGACLKCSCAKFTWKGFRQGYEPSRAS